MQNFKLIPTKALIERDLFELEDYKAFKPLNHQSSKLRFTFTFFISRALRDITRYTSNFAVAIFQFRSSSIDLCALSKFFQIYCDFSPIYVRFSL